MEFHCIPFSLTIHHGTTKPRSMKHLDPDSTGQFVDLVSMRVIEAQGAEVFGPHRHNFLEFTLVTDGSCRILHPDGEKPTRPNTLYLYHLQEEHGAICNGKDKPRFWVLHFNLNDSLSETFVHLRQPRPAHRVWELNPEQAGAFQWMFWQIFNERSARRKHFDFAVSTWLELLLLNIERWCTESGGTSLPLNTPPNPDVARLWHLVNQGVSRPNDDLSFLFESPNYDSARHAFRKSFGCSPREMLFRLRLEYAKNLLLETNLSIKEIAAKVGYPRQHDFNRLFKRQVGVAPSAWRENPLVSR